MLRVTSLSFAAALLLRACSDDDPGDVPSEDAQADDGAADVASPDATTSDVAVMDATHLDASTVEDAATASDAPFDATAASDAGPAADTGIVDAAAVDATPSCNSNPTSYSCNSSLSFVLDRLQSVTTMDGECSFCGGNSGRFVQGFCTNDCTQTAGGHKGFTENQVLGPGTYFVNMRGMPSSGNFIIEDVPPLPANTTCAGAMTLLSPVKYGLQPRVVATQLGPRYYKVKPGPGGTVFAPGSAYVAFNFTTWGPTKLEVRTVCDDPATVTSTFNTDTYGGATITTPNGPGPYFVLVNASGGQQWSMQADNAVP
jgi:hypothetical protein